MFIYHALASGRSLAHLFGSFLRGSLGDNDPFAGEKALTCDIDGPSATQDHRTR